MNRRTWVHRHASWSTLRASLSRMPLMFVAGGTTVVFGMAARFGCTSDATTEPVAATSGAGGEVDNPTCSNSVRDGFATGIDCDGGAGDGGAGDDGAGGGDGGDGGGEGEAYGCDVGRGGAEDVFLYVDAAAPYGGTGRKSDPFHTIQQAFLAVGRGQHATVCVAEGTYTEHVGATGDIFDEDRRYTFVGGFASGTGFAVRDSAVYTTVVQAPSPSAATFTFGNTRAFTLDGFSITGGSHGVLVRQEYSAGRSVTLLHNHIYGNGIDGGFGHRGAGASIRAGTVLVQGNLIEDNHGGQLGGGIYVGSAVASERNTKDVASQTLRLGSALATIKDNTVRNNTLRYDTPHGAGIAVAMNAIIEGNVVTGNAGYRAATGGDGSGSGIYVGGQYVTAVIARNWVSGNTGLHGGAGIFADEAAITSIFNNVVTHNTANLGRGALLVDGRASGSGSEDRGYSTIVNNTIVSNVGGGVAVTDSTVCVYNNLFAGNGSSGLELTPGGPIAERATADANRFDSIPTQPGIVLGDRNVVTLPAFVDAAHDKYQLAPGSALLDIGRATFTPAFAHPGALTAAPPDDFDGAPRPWGGGFDPGAYEAR